MGNPITFELESIVQPTLPLPKREPILKQIEKMSLLANRSQSLNRELDDQLEEVTELIRRIKNHPKGTPPHCSTRHNASGYACKSSTVN